jgi:hypothetical protein
MIEDRLAELTAAVNALAAALRAAPPPAVAAQAPAPTDAPEPLPEAQVVTLDDVRQALLTLGRDKARDLLREYDVQRLPDLAPAAYPSVLAEAKRRAA